MQQPLTTGLAATTKTTANPMQRRAERLDGQNNIAVLEQANQALGQLPPEQQKQYAPAIQQALAMAKGGGR